MKLDSKKKIDLRIGLPLVIILKPLVYLLGLILRRPHDLNIKKNLAFFKFQGGGSLVIAMPALLGLKQAYPQTKLILTTTRSVKPFAELLHVFDEINVIDDRSFLTLIFSSIKVLWKLIGIDTIVDLEVYSFLSAVFGLFTLARNRIGFYLETVFWRRQLFTHLIFFNRYSGTYYFYEDICKLFKAIPATWEQCRDHLVSKNGFIKSPSSVVAIGHGCSEFGKERTLTPLQWLKILSKETSQSEVVLLGGKEDFPPGEAIRLELEKGLKVKNASGQHSLKDSVQILYAAKKFYGVDSSLLHFARALGVPNESFWGPTDPATRLKPVAGYQEKAHYRKTPCSPCIHVAEEPPCQGKNICITGLFDEKPSHEFNSFIL